MTDTVRQDLTDLKASGLLDGMPGMKKPGAINLILSAMRTLSYNQETIDWVTANPTEALKSYQEARDE